MRAIHYAPVCEAVFETDDMSEFVATGFQESISEKMLNFFVVIEDGIIFGIPEVRVVPGITLDADSFGGHRQPKNKVPRRSRIQIDVSKDQK